MSILKKNKSKSNRCRSSTINQTRLEKLMSMGNNTVRGLKIESLGLSNCPKEVLIGKAIFKRAYELNGQQKEIKEEELETFMIKKYNLFKTNAKNSKLIKKSHQNWLCYKFYKKTSVESQIKQADSEQFDNKMLKILKLLRVAYRSDPHLFKGLESQHFQYNYCVPSSVIIEKSALKKLCNENKNQDEDLISKIKKLYRALSFFFTARFNLINITNKNRKFMVFGRNHPLDEDKRLQKRINKYLESTPANDSFNKSPNRNRNIPKITDHKHQKHLKLRNAKRVSSSMNLNASFNVNSIKLKKKKRKRNKPKKIKLKNNKRSNYLKVNHPLVENKRKDFKKIKTVSKQKIHEMNSSNIETCSGSDSPSDLEGFSIQDFAENKKTSWPQEKKNPMKVVNTSQRTNTKQQENQEYNDEEILIQNWTEMSEEELQGQLIGLLLNLKNSLNEDH
ncbi:hypothetical protein M0813_05757 [Anaeramoeba flamelloides]|uniref:Uncharacterized protein n=1 Tax=Anaeramoeba flamelloides TaxID=1746091 RepID=A0ABQ8XGQ3_9EUKA|nr:hypothetical protein M0813_05757 [Anaeramoeba flamelloides]